MKQRVIEARYDFTGGLNVTARPDQLQANELSRMDNFRLEETGALRPRYGSAVLNSPVLGAGGSVLGVFQWAAPSAVLFQTVAIANGKLYYLNDAATGTFTEVTPASGTFATGYNQITDFATFRDPGGLRLYMASNGTVYKWDGTTLTKINGTNSVPNASCLRSYLNRMFYNDVSNPKTLFWSAIGDGSTCVTGGPPAGGNSLVDVLDNDKLVAFEALGNSLLIGTQNSIIRFTGVSDDIKISTDTAGVSADIGVDNVGAFNRVEQVAYVWRSNEVYLVTEGGATSISDKLRFVNPQSEDTRAPYTTAIPLMGHLKSRHEIWFAYYSVGNFSTRTFVLVYNYRLQAWSGPFIFPFNITSLTMRYGSAQNVALAFIVAGCDDGKLRILDTSAYTSDEAGTSAFAATVRFAPFIFADAGPHNTKALRSVYVQRERVAGVAPFIMGVTADGVGTGGGIPIAETGAVAPVTGLGTPSTDRYDVDAQGKRLEIELSLSSGSLSGAIAPQIVGLIAEGSRMDRW